MEKTRDARAHRRGSSVVRARALQQRTWQELIPNGEPPDNQPGRPEVTILNANPFALGIANLGWQTVACHLQQREINVHVAFADTVSRGHVLDDSHRRAVDCQILAFSIPFEDTYLNVLRMLDALGLPLRSQDRSADHPLVVAGGMAMINPIPFSEFVDVVIVGEGRQALAQIAERYDGLRQRGMKKKDALYALADLPGVYIPSHYRLEIDRDGYVVALDCSNGRPRVESAPTLDLSSHPIYSHWTSPHACYEDDDYFSVMAAMGCHNKCPFCVVGTVQGSPDGHAISIEMPTVLELARERRRRYGTKLVKIFFSSAFSSRAAGEQGAALKALLRDLIQEDFACRVGSLNVRQADEELFELLRAGGQTEITFAPETNERQRPGIGKAYITDGKMHELAGYARKYRLSLNIYSLACLPGETDDDTRAYARLLASLRRALGRRQRMYVHYNPAFMKAQTAFQYFGNARPSEIRRKFRLLRQQLVDHNIEFVSVIDDPMVYYQPVLSLGDSQSAAVMLQLFRRQQPTEDDWERAFYELGLDDSRYFRAKDPNRTLPWEHIAFTDHERLRRRALAIGRREGEERDTPAAIPVQDEVEDWEPFGAVPVQRA